MSNTFETHGVDEFATAIVGFLKDRSLHEDTKLDLVRGLCEGPMSLNLCRMLCDNSGVKLPQTPQTEFMAMLKRQVRQRLDDRTLTRLSMDIKLCLDD